MSPSRSLTTTSFLPNGRPRTLRGWEDQYTDSVSSFITVGRAVSVLKRLTEIRKKSTAKSGPNNSTLAWRLQESVDGLRRAFVKCSTGGLWRPHRLSNRNEFLG